MIQDLRGHVAIVTGANTGIGKETSTALALRGAHVFMACRSQGKAEKARQEIQEVIGGQGRLEVLPLDLGDLESVRLAAQQFINRGLPLHMLICNAGLAGQKGITRSGFELAFGTCHIGHFLFTRLLMDTLRASAPARVVVVSSKAHRHVKDFSLEQVRQPTSSTGGIREYAHAKLANLLFVSELSHQLEGSGVNVYALHPGIVASDVWRSAPALLRGIIKPFMMTPEQGAATSLWGATSADCAQESGLYYEDCKRSQTSTLARNRQLAQELWDYSERCTAR